MKIKLTSQEEYTKNRIAYFKSIGQKPPTTEEISRMLGLSLDRDTRYFKELPIKRV